METTFDGINSAVFILSFLSDRFSIHYFSLTVLVCGLCGELAVSTELRSQYLFDFGARSGDSRLDGTNIGAGELSDFIVGHVFEFAKHNRCTELSGQGSDCRLHHIVEIFALHQFFWTSCWVCDIAGRSILIVIAEHRLIERDNWS